MRIVSLFLAFLIAGLGSCKYGNEYHPVITANFSISVPDWLKKQDNLKPGAEFQYANRFRNFYAIGETLGADQSKDSLQAIMQQNLAILRKSMKGAVVTDSVNTSVNGLDGARVEIYGKMNDENIYFSELLITGKKHLYHLSIWTRAEERKLRFNKDIDAIFASFKEN
jgi:hypothetical protein